MYLTTRNLFKFSTKKLFVGANWKSNNTKLQTQELLNTVFNKLKYDHKKVDVVLAPAFVHLHLAQSNLKDKNIQLAAQNCSAYSFGAYTGQISPEHIKDVGVEWVIVGHSQRRNHFNESPHFVVEKTKTALKNNLKVIFCFGENLVERRSQMTESIIRKQLQPLVDAMAQLPAEAWNNIVLAYEPVWAIGTGVNASPQQAEEACAFTRTHLEQFIPGIVENIRIIYGGSVTDKNSADLIKQANIDGFLVGGASLKQSFKKIVEHTKKEEQIHS